MKKTHLLCALMLLISAVVVSGCMSLDKDADSLSYTSNEKAVSGYDSATEDSVRQVSSGGAGTVSVDRKTITTVDMTLEVDEVPAAIEQISASARAFGGYVSGSSVYSHTYDSGTWKDGYITVRVPEAEHPLFLEEVGKLGEVTSRSVSGQDVTEEYIDVTARLENLKKQEQRLHEVLNMSRTVEEVLSVEKEIERVRGEIDSLTGRLNYLNDRVEYSTISIRLTESDRVVYSWGLGDALSESVRGFISMINALIILAGYMLPIIILLALFGGLFVALRRMARR
ncbi:DUF4349 domain-containing protein [Methanolobus sp.]|uniref:DUF4349 domain-containing protein n=1 Tax=Methanolobus sp. TaxID=1874737 RepID=UPI0025E2054C|nr:DUF4349 domain-containing protein [Methanolobus sp.]